MMKDRKDLHETVTNQIIAAIEAGAGEWQFPWRRSNGALHLPTNILTGKRYRGINIVSLWGSSQERGFSHSVWGTYKQWNEKGCQVRGGEKGSLVVVYKEFHVEPNEGDSKDDGKRMFARASWVFNASQVDGYQDNLPDMPDAGPVERLDAAERFIAATGAIVRHGGDRAFFSPSTDHIQMPDDGRFIGDQQRRTERYYGVALHELTHWTGAKKRLDREFGKRFGDGAYAFEELVAELGAAFSCGLLNITNEPRPDHARYIANWLAILKQDNRAIFTAAAKASAAVDYLEGFQNNQKKAAA